MRESLMHLAGTCCGEAPADVLAASAARLIAGSNRLGAFIKSFSELLLVSVKLNLNSPPSASRLQKTPPSR